MTVHDPGGAVRRRQVPAMLLPAIRGIACGIVLAGSVATQANAQQGAPQPSAELGTLRCSATTAAPLVRIEGLSELIGDILITCENVGPAVRFEARGFLDAEVTLSLNVGVANRSGFGLGPDVTDAVLVVNEKECTASSADRVFNDCGSGGSLIQDPMLARRVTARPATLRWAQVALPIPGAAIGSDATEAVPVADCTGRVGVPGGCHPSRTTVRLTNIRVRAAEAGVSGEPASGTIPIEASVSVRAKDGVVLLAGSLLRVAEAAPGVSAQASSAQSNRLCSSGELIAEVKVSEGFASAFKAAGRPSHRPSRPGREDGYFPTTAAAAGQLAATRLRVVLSEVPEGVSIRVPAAPECLVPGSAGGLRLGLVEGASSNGSGGTVVSAGQGELPLTVSQRAETVALYEVLAADPLAHEECRIPFRLTKSDPGGDTIRGREVSVAASLAPVGPAREGVPGPAGPRFVDVKKVPRPTFRVGTCGTTLFFPFVTNQTTFDTAVVVVNTSADPLGTRHEPGRCSLTFHGSGVEGQPPEAVQRTVEVDAGKQVAFRLSGGNIVQGLAPLPDFQGYLVAECSFQHAQGFAFVTEQVGGASVLAQGYLAEVLAEPPATVSATSNP